MNQDDNDEIDRDFWKKRLIILQLYRIWMKLMSKTQISSLSWFILQHCHGGLNVLRGVIVSDMILLSFQISVQEIFCNLLVYKKALDLERFWHYVNKFCFNMLLLLKGKLLFDHAIVKHQLLNPYGTIWNTMRTNERTNNTDLYY